MRRWRSVLTGRPAISVVMATYNGEVHLAEQLDSLAAQTRPPDELVVRDDGSEDGTVALLHAFARRARFRVDVRTGGPRLGYAQNFMAASRECSGGVVFFADQDDVWRPTKLATVAQRVRRRLPEAVFHDVALVDARGAEISPSYFGLLAERGLPPAVAIKGCTMAVTRAFLEAWGWPPVTSTVSHDFWVALLATAFDQRTYLTEPLVDHRLHGANTSGWLPDASSRELTAQGDGASDSALLVDLVVKRRRVRTWTKDLLAVLDERGDVVDAAASARLREVLRSNRRRHRAARESSDEEAT
jgi:glycosyltransferase involved in cell wall biosynthesis